MEAEIISIGTEILLGEILDTNTQTMARALRDVGLNLYRTITVGDNAERIAQAVLESMARSQAVLTTGGLGPTVDDVTREGVAMAFDVEMEFHPELWEQIQERFARFGYKPTENNRRQAYLPKGAQPIENPIGTAPGFLIDTEDFILIALQGVPAEMSYLLENEAIPFLQSKLKLPGVIKIRLLRISGVGESSLDAQIQDLEKMSNPTVGLAAHPGRVDIRITAKADTPQAAKKMIAEIEAILRERLGEAIYGVDDDTLEAAALRNVAMRSWRLVVLESGTEGALADGLAAAGEAFIGGQVLPQIEDVGQLKNSLKQFQEEAGAEVGLGLMVHKSEPQYNIHIVLRTPEEEKDFRRSYGGPPTYASQWAASLALEVLRRGIAD